MAYVKKNYEHSGLEIYFDSKPSKDFLTMLKDNHWRWHREKKCWYNRDNSFNESFANEICETINLGKREIRISSKSNASLRQYSSHVPAYASKFLIGDYVEFESEVFGLQHGQIIAIDNFTETADIKYPYYSESDDEEYEFTDYQIYWNNMSKCKKSDIVHHYKKALTEKEKLLNEYGFKIGDKVELKVDGYDAIGKIRSVSYVYLKEVNVSYSYYNEYDEKYVGDIDINIAYIKKFEGYKKYDYENLTPKKQREMDFNDRVKERIKSKTDDFADAKVAQKENALFKHQKAGCLLAEKYDKFAFFYDTGTGKTAMALDIIHTKFTEENVRFLIISPKAIIKTAWMEDAERFYPDLRILPLSKGFSKFDQKRLLDRWKKQEKNIEQNIEVKSKEIKNHYVELLSAISGIRFDKIIQENDEDQRSLEDMAQHYIVNAELFIRDPDKYIYGLNVSGIIVDESAILKNCSGKTSQILFDECQHMKYVYLLSGKPAPNNEMEYFSQMRIVDPETFSMNYYQFARDFGVDPNVRQINLSDSAKQTMAKLISGRSLIISKEDCLDLPDTIDIIRQFELPDNIMEEYNRLLVHSLALIKGMDHSSRVYSTNAKMAVLMKLRQMASGFFIMENDRYKYEKEIVEIHESKIDALNDVLDEIGDYQVVVWCQFRYEIERVAEELSSRGEVVTAYGGTKNLDQNISDFKTGKAKYIVAHPKTLKYGVTFTNCQYMIYYSFSYSAEDYDQSHDRIYRLGQKNKCTFIFLQAADTIDELMYQKVMKKQSNAEFMEQLIKNASEHGIDYSSLKEADDIDFSSIIEDINKEKEEKENEIEYPDFYEFPYEEPSDDDLEILEQFLEKENGTSYIINFNLWNDDCYWDFSLDDLVIWHVDETIDIPGSIIEETTRDKVDREFERLLERESRLDDSMQQLEFYIEEQLSTLTEREVKVLYLRFGLLPGTSKMTYEAVGREFNLTRERIRQIEAEALRKLRHPSRGHLCYLGEMFNESEDGSIDWFDPKFTVVDDEDSYGFSKIQETCEIEPEVIEIEEDFADIQVGQGTLHFVINRIYVDSDGDITINLEVRNPIDENLEWNIEKVIIDDIGTDSIYCRDKFYCAGKMYKSKWLSFPNKSEIDLDLLSHEVQVIYSETYAGETNTYKILENLNFSNEPEISESEMTSQYLTDSQILIDDENIQLVFLGIMKVKYGSIKMMLSVERKAKSYSYYCIKHVLVNDVIISNNYCYLSIPKSVGDKLIEFVSVSDRYIDNINDVVMKVVYNNGYGTDVKGVSVNTGKLMDENYIPSSDSYIRRNRFALDLKEDTRIYGEKSTVIASSFAKNRTSHYFDMEIRRDYGDNKIFHFEYVITINGFEVCAGKEKFGKNDKAVVRIKLKDEILQVIGINFIQDSDIHLTLKIKRAGWNKEDIIGKDYRLKWSEFLE